jgi:hypothetical protein
MFRNMIKLTLNKLTKIKMNYQNTIITLLFLTLTQLARFIKNERVSDIDLSTADLSDDYKYGTQIYTIEAFSRWNNKAIIEYGEEDKYEQLEWRSFGVPRLAYRKIKNTKKEENKYGDCELFEINNRGIIIFIDMLT